MGASEELSGKTVSAIMGHIVVNFGYSIHILLVYLCLHPSIEYNGFVLRIHNIHYLIRLVAWPCFKSGMTQKRCHCGQG